MKDEAGHSTTERTRVALLHIIATSRLLTILKNDKKAIFSAAAAASAATDYILAFSRNREEVA